MVKHVVLWKLKENAEGNAKSKDRKLVKKNLMSLKPVISEINTLEIGENFNTSDSAFDMVLITTHMDIESLSAYIDHPAHKKAAEFIGKVVAERKVVDFEC